MKTFLTIFTLMFLVSCGKNVTKTRFVENKFDASEIENKLVDHERRIKALEDLTSELERLEEKVIDMEAEMGRDFDSVRKSVNDLESVMFKLTSKQLKVFLSAIKKLRLDLKAIDSSKAEIKSICESSEQMLVVGDKSYAVMSTIVLTNSQKLASNVHLGEIKPTKVGQYYELTDGSGIRFTVNDEGVFTCSNSN